MILYDHIYPKYWDILPNLNKSILLPTDESKIVLDEWQTV